MRNPNESGKYCADAQVKKKSAGRNAYALVIKIELVLLAILAVIVGGMIIMVIQAQDAEADFKELAAYVQTDEPISTNESRWILEKTELIDGTEISENADLTQTQYLQTTAQTMPREILSQYQSVYEKNPELFGWIQIDNTRIDYPVMHTPDDPEKYLHMNFDGEYSFAGVPFVDAKCSADSDNLLIYGHNMTDGSMFRGIMKYQQKDFWQRNPVIRFNTLYEEQEFEVLAAFYDRVYYKTETCFKFYQFIDAADEADFDNAITQFKSKALYDTGVDAVYGDQLITLITCTDYTDNGRFVVVAKCK